MENENKQGQIALSMRILKMVDADINTENSPLIKLGVFIIMLGIGALLFATAYNIAF